MLGKLRPEFFPRVFGPGQDQPLDADIVRERFEAVTAQINAAYGGLKDKSVYVRAPSSFDSFYIIILL